MDQYICRWKSVVYLLIYFCFLGPHCHIWKFPGWESKQPQVPAYTTASNMESELGLRYTPQLRAMLDP